MKATGVYTDFWNFMIDQGVMPEFLYLDGLRDMLDLYEVECGKRFDDGFLDGVIACHG